MSDKKSRWQQYKEKNGVTPLDMLNPKSRHVPLEVAKGRFEICLQCPEILPITHQCKKCGCFMGAKTKLEAAKCPLGKW